jgi:hypothetical protein
MSFCANCGAAVEPGTAACPACGAPQGAATAAPAAATAGPAPAAAAAPVSTLLNLARGAKGLALLFFLLPWVTVSCAGRELQSVTGLQLATGKAPPMAANGIPGAGPAVGPDAAAQAFSPEIAVIAAALLIVAGLAATFLLPRRRAALAGMVAAALAAALIVFEVFVRVMSAAEAEIRARMAGPTNGGGGLAAEFQREVRRQLEPVANAISVDPALGFWLTLIALIAAVVLLALVLNRPAET